MTDVEGRTAFITGGGNGIGLGIARRFARAGAKLALADVDEAALARAEAELRPITRVETFTLDVRDRDAFAAIANSVERSLGPVTLLFNNAGVAGGAPATRLNYDLWDWCIDINLGGVINGVQTFLPKMMEFGRGGHIVNTASGAGLAPTGAGVLYTTAKYGVVGMSEALNLELGILGIGVSVLCPGPVATGIVQRSANAAPQADATLSDEQKALIAERLAQSAAYLQQGVGIDAVGEMVLQSVQTDALYIHTDRAVEELVKARNDALLAAMPA